MNSVSRRVTSQRQARPPSSAGLAALVVGATVLGILPVALSTAASLALAALLLLILVVSAVVMLLRRGSAATTTRVSVTALAQPEADSGAGRLLLRLGRGLFFVGAATVTEATWRHGLTVSEAALFASLACCCLAVLRGHPVERLPVPVAGGACVFAIAGLLSSISGASSLHAVYELGRPVWVLLLWPWTAAMVLRTRRDLLAAILLWGVSGAINGVEAFAQTTGITPITGTFGAHRVPGFTSHPNDLGGAAAVAFVPMLALAVRVRARSRVIHLAEWVMVALILMALVLSGSVGSAIAALLAVIIWMASPSVRGTVRVAIVLGLVAGFVVTSTLGGNVPSPARRVVQVLGKPGSGPNIGSVHDRLSMIAAAWPRIRANPFVGTGLSNSHLIIHNEAVAAWYATGIFGLAGLLLVTGALLVLGWRGSQVASTDEDRAVGWSLVSAFVGFMVFAMTEPLYFQEYGWIAGALIAGWATTSAYATRDVKLKHSGRNGRNPGI